MRWPRCSSASTEPNDLAHDLLHAHEAAADALFRKLEDGGFGIAENIFGRVRSGRDARAIAVVGGGNQSAQQRFVAHNLDVMLNARPVGHAIDQAGDVGHIADRLQILVPVEFLDQRDHVDRPRRLRQIDHAGVNAAMRVEREIFNPQMLGGLVVGKVVEQDRAQNRALGLYVRRKRADRVIGSCQGIFPGAICQGRNRTLFSSPL